MIERIIHALNDLQIRQYGIREIRSRSAEAFYVRRRQDLKRRTTLTDYTVSVYRDFEKDGKRFTGDSSVPVYPGMEESELKEALRTAYHAASFVPNPYYPLISGSKEELVPSKSGFAGKSPEENLKAVAEAIFAAEDTEEVFINSAEIFAEQWTSRVINSNGMDVSWENWNLNGEYVIQCLSPADVETHHTFSLREPDLVILQKEVADAMTRTKDRARAANPPKGGRYTVILSEEHVNTLLSYYLDRSDASMVYQHYSDYAPGQAVQGGEIRGDALTVILKAADPYDLQGVPLHDRTLLENGVLQTIHGARRFCYYLGIEPTGIYRSIQVPIGSTPLAEMKKQPYLHIVSFSDFQMDSFSGHFGGEIRLAYLFDGKTVKTVTGGSVNGILPEVQGQMIFSKERYRSSRYDGPLAVSIRNVTVGGIEEE